MFSNGYELDQRTSACMAGVYGWMSCALTITAGVSYYVAGVPAIFSYLYTHPGAMFGLIFAQFAFVFALTLFLNRMTFITALICFLLYAATFGITLSSIFYVYTESSILSTFLTTAGMFAVMSLYGYTTKADLTNLGTMSFMALVGLIIGLFINIFLKNQQFDYILSGIGVVLFVVLIAYDTQKIRLLMRSLLVEQEMIGKITLLGALTLYLDFVNLFLFLLRFMGNRRE